MIITPQNYTPRWYQIEAHRARDMGYLYLLLLWHRQTGKDLFTLCECFREMVKVVGNYFYFFPTYTQARKSLWERKCENGIRFLDRMPGELIKKCRSNDMYMELHNGSILRAVGADKKNIDNLVGTAPIGVCMSEFGVGKDYQVVFDLMMPILQNNGGWFIGNGTPRGRNHYYDLYCNALNMPKVWYVSALQTISPTYPTGRYTGIIKPQLLRQSLDQGMDVNTFHQENGVSFAAGVRGSIFGTQVSRAMSQGRVKEITIDNHSWVETFWDLGSKDYAAVWFMQRIGDRKVWIDYYQHRYEDWPHYVDMLGLKKYKYSYHHVPHDAKNRYVMMASLTPASIFKKCLESSGVSGKVKQHKRPTDITMLIDGCKRNFDYYYFNKPKLEAAIRMVESYHFEYDKVKKVYTKKPLHDDSSHCCSALMLETIVRNPVLYTGENIADEIAKVHKKYSRSIHTESIVDRFNR